MSKPTGAAIRASVAYWQTVLGLEDWVFTIQIGRLPGGDYGSCEVNIPYKKAHLRFWPQGIVDNLDTVDGVVVHELLGHIIPERLAAKALSLCKTDKDRTEVSDYEEAVATDIERLILRLHKRAS